MLPDFSAAMVIHDTFVLWCEELVMDFSCRGGALGSTPTKRWLGHVCSMFTNSQEFRCPGAEHGCPSPVVFMLLSTPQGLSTLSGLLPCCWAARKLSPDVKFSSWISPSKIREINLFSILITVCVFYYCTRKLRNHNVLGAIQRLTVHSYEALSSSFPSYPVSPFPLSSPERSRPTPPYSPPACPLLSP